MKLGDASQRQPSRIFWKMPDSPTIKINDLLQVKAMSESHSPTYSCRVEDLSADTIQISWPTDRGTLVPINQNCPLQLSFNTADGPYGLLAVVRAKQTEPIPILKLRAAGPPEKIQRREFYRTPTAVSVEITVATDQILHLAPDKIRHFRTVTHDISGGGMSIRSETSMQVGTVVEARLSLPDELPAIKAPLKVANCVPMPPRGGKHFYRIGMDFLSLTEAERSRIIRYLIKVQMKHLAAR